MRLVEFFLNLDPRVQSALISAITTLIVILISGFIKLIYDRYSLRHKLRVEYNFEQQKSIKEEISKSKMPLISAAENMNYRLWNLQTHLDENWLEISEVNWNNENHHYIRSFVYRWLRLVYWVLKAEESVHRFDSTLSPSEDIIYLKYLKALKFSLCDRFLLAACRFEDDFFMNR